MNTELGKNINPRANNIQTGAELDFVVAVQK